MQIKAAIKALDELPESKVLMNSGYYKSKPMGPKNQPDYVNAVVEIETVWPADELLKKCQSIEQHQGRVKNRHWGERSIDLDILLYADQQIKTDELSVPHPGIDSRDFVYMPLLKINPEVQVPPDKTSCYDRCQIPKCQCDQSCLLLVLKLFSQVAAVLTTTSDPLPDLRRIAGYGANGSVQWTEPVVHF